MERKDKELRGSNNRVRTRNEEGPKRRMGLKQVLRGFMGQQQRTQALKGQKGRVEGGKYDTRGRVEGLSMVEEELD